jgi:hypothetical protein
MENIFSLKLNLRASKEIFFPIVVIGSIAILSIVLSRFENSLLPDIFVGGSISLLFLSSPFVLLGENKNQKAKILFLLFGLIWLVIFSFIPFFDLLCLLGMPS